MLTSPFLSISRLACAIPTLIAVFLFCGNVLAEDNLLDGRIDYPFAEDSAPIGKDSGGDRFIIRSTVGQTEYSVEIPGAGRDYDIEVPLADLKNAGIDQPTGSISPEDLGKPQTTDKEFIKDMPRLPDPEDRALVEGAFGLGHSDGPRQSPSYTLRLAKINKLYVGRQYEYAIIEINNMLTYYPTSVKLHKMKGTVLMKLRNFKMAEQAWSRASELAPEDVAVRKALESLRQRFAAQQKQSTATAVPLTH